MELIHRGLEKVWSFLYHTYYLDLRATAFSFAISAGMVLGVLTVELAYVGYDRSGFRRVFFKPSKSTITDITFFVLQTTGMMFLFAALSSLGLSYFISHAVKNITHLDLGAHLPGWVHVLLFVILSDFLCYWQHRIMHWSPALWRLHEFHHAAEEFNALTSVREHPLEKTISMVVMVVPALVLGVPTSEFTIVFFFFSAVGYVKHSAIPWHGWFGKNVIQSPRDHAIHHSKLKEHHNRNLANYFPIWDHLFGTYYEGDAIGAELGSDQAYFNRTDPLRESIATQIRFTRGSWQSAKTQVSRAWRSASIGRNGLTRTGL